MAGVLEPLRPLVYLLAQAEAPAALAERLCRMAQAGAPGDAIRDELAGAVADGVLAGDVLTHAQVLDADGTVTPVAAVRLGQAQVLAEMRTGERCELVLTVPAFLRDALDEAASANMADGRPRETLLAITEVASTARERLVIAAPYLHPGLVAVLAGHVERITRGGGQAVVITRALSPGSPSHSAPNRESIALLRAAAHRAAQRLIVHSWEEEGLGIHFKAMTADHRLGYLGSANLTPWGAYLHAEAGVLLRGRQAALLADWLDRVALVLDRRRFSSR
jgi:phosphatidylserine/phosphatidylglycerophosphate/cardiolipin synthase-like enzyme